MKVTDLGQLKKCLEETKNYTGLKISTLADTAAGAIEEVTETAELNQANIEEIKFGNDRKFTCFNRRTRKTIRKH